MCTLNEITPTIYDGTKVETKLWSRLESLHIGTKSSEKLKLIFVTMPSTKDLVHLDFFIQACSSYLKQDNNDTTNNNCYNILFKPHLYRRYRVNMENSSRKCIQICITRERMYNTMSD